MRSPRPILATCGAAALALVGLAPAAAASSGTAPASSHNGTLLLVGAAILLVFGGGLVVVRRYAHPDAHVSEREPLLPQTAAGIKFEALLGASRRLKQLGSASERHHALLREAIGLVGAHTGALILRQGDGRVVAYEAEPGLLVPDSLLAGAIGRVAESGQALVEVGSDEPAIGHLPVALVAVPLPVDGSIHGVLVLVRPPDAPFSPFERDLLNALAPVAASGMPTAVAGS